jgi:hypothetical protein
MSAPLSVEELRERRKLGCFYCAGEAEPGWIETDNNGPIGPCPFCNSSPPSSPRSPR